MLVDERPQHQRTSFKRPRRAPDAPQGTPRIVVCVDLNRNPTGQSGPYCKSTQHIGALLTGRSASSQEGEQAGSQAGTGSSRQIYTDFFRKGEGGPQAGSPSPNIFLSFPVSWCWICSLQHLFVKSPCFRGENFLFIIDNLIWRPPSITFSFKTTALTNGS